MKRRFIERIGTLAAACATLACASATPQSPPPPPPAPTPAVMQSIEPLSEDREHLSFLVEATLESIERREVLAAALIQADVDAAASLEMPDHASVQSAIRLFSDRLQPKIQASLDRSTIYKPMIDAVLDEYQLPRALAYLPVIESGYISSSVSRAGALGIWQFMPGTAREYGLRVDWWVDERLDPLRSTHAAAAYLRDLYSMFGDWPLAVASYNAGPGRVRRTMSAMRADSFWDMQRRSRLPRETRGYVPTFYATLAIVSDPQTHGFRLCDPVGSPWDEVDHIKVNGPVTLDYIADIAHLAAETVYSLNPSFRQGIVPPGASTIVVPGDGAELVRDMVPYLTESDPYLPVARYSVRGGESLRSVGRRLGVSHFAIAAMNGNIRSLRAGDEIFVPVKRTDLPERLLQASFETVHVVRRGDTLSGIARKYGLSARELAEMNNISVKSLIHPGDRLLITTSGVFAAGM
jgi:membrane-bound lytic murein transglycosylase D